MGTKEFKNAVMELMNAIEDEPVSTFGESYKTESEKITSRELDESFLEARRCDSSLRTATSCGLKVAASTTNDVIYVCPTVYQSFKFVPLKCCGNSKIVIKYVGEFDTEDTLICTPYGTFDVSRGEIFFTPNFRNPAPEGVLVRLAFKAFSCGVSSDFWVNIVFTSCACCCVCKKSDY